SVARPDARARGRSWRTPTPGPRRHAAPRLERVAGRALRKPRRADAQARAERSRAARGVGSRRVAAPRSARRLALRGGTDARGRAPRDPFLDLLARRAERLRASIGARKRGHARGM